MEQQIIDRVNWLYAANAGAKPKAEYVEQAVNELLENEFLRDLITMLGMTLGEYIEDLKKKVQAV